MVQFSKIRLTGFKSFVDPTELELSRGLTGIVGPNGCGKSNILEAFRWCMGEGSARQLRGGGMDDVIFNGTADRPARNIAEVSIDLDNGARDAPAAVNGFERIDVVRRIERERGSSYRINGNEARARDVQLLFADLQTGARSTAIVSQGRVAAMIAAKPAERRLVLEEAAGITGLHSRRHEAELRLKGAETNLDRLEDLLTELAEQMQRLKRQVRQATRYRNISGHIRRTEAVLLHLRWTEADAALAEARQARADADRQVDSLTGAAAGLAQRSAEGGAALAVLRDEAAGVAAKLQRHLVERDGLIAEAGRLAARRTELAQRLEQIDRDLERERAQLADAAGALGRLDEELRHLDRADAGDEAARTTAAAAVQERRAEVEAFETEVTAATERAAAREARRVAAQDRVAAQERTLGALGQRILAAETERDALGADEAGSGLEAAQRMADAAEEDLTRVRAAADRAEAERDNSAEAVEQARGIHQAHTETLTRLRAEADTLTALLERRAAGDTRPAIEDIRVTAGYEAALGAALGDDLDAPVDSRADGAAAIRWQADAETGEEGPDLPRAARPLSWFVDAPAALTRRLDQIAVVEDSDLLEAVAPLLAQGQRAVSRDGGMVRWDGFVVAAGAPTAAAQRLAQQNRLETIGRETVAVERQVAAARDDLEAARTAADAADEAWRSANAAVGEAFDLLNARRAALASLNEAAVSQRSRLEAVAEALAALESERAEAAEALSAALAGLDAIPEDSAAQAQLSDMRDNLAALRRDLAEREQTGNRLEAEATARERLRAAAREDAARWRRRIEDGEAQVAALEERRGGIADEAAEIERLPDDLAARQAAADALVAESEAARDAAAAAQAEAESALAGIDRELREAEKALAEAREGRGLAEGRVSQAGQTVSQITERCAERLNCRPEALLEVAEQNPDQPLPTQADIERRLDRLLRERDGMGPVNHRAEQESKELGDRIEELETERDDLIGAIERFRRAIATLNREGRERLLASFETVNGHFQALFTRLYGGGRAHLALTESDDPLNAGLEIMASPPGKRLQSLSLLSGGEQALTAIALLFAVFLTNPAPICILDEVDAPLDDNNVDRFCTLVEDIAEESGTRFLIVTHNRLTMARMDRLYGVTMAERGVSQLVSVDLREAEALRETA
ncbi:MAG: chromosome segregation protein SMC [Rhodospirillaceae bacterium]|nr:chromosome segregation protein SMC [Rhodospirillaceae bacterium]MYB15400.1 chromosome segregation protein SMC [Rhodospirillaceae bacterium]MYI48381.1 chromosome segregation protein SMC [Rhodospirillaceae bacterium]